MKNNKLGFTLAEMLIVFGIIAIILTLGITISKKGFDKAYNLYIYTAYDGIQDAISEANFNSQTAYTVPEKFMLSIAGLLKSQTETATINSLMPSVPSSETTVEIGTLGDLSDPTEEQSEALNRLQGNIPTFGTEFSTSNGSTVAIGIKQTTTLMGHISSTTTQNYDVFYFKVKVPAKKTKENNTGKKLICLAYEPKNEMNVLIPSNTACKSVKDGEIKYIDVLDRTDLLPFYIDNGINGRVMQYKETSGSVKFSTKGGIKYMSLRDAICTVYGTGTYAGETISCDSSISQKSEKGIIKVENPRKVF